MKNAKLQYLCALNKEIFRLEKIEAQMQKSRDCEKRKDFQRDLEWCKEEKIRLIKENLLEDLELTNKEKVMASFYYYEGETWEMAFEDMVLKLELTTYNEYSDDELSKCRNTLKKYILRKVERYTNYYRK